MQNELTRKNKIKLTTMSFPAFSGLFAILIAAAAAPPDEIPTCNTCLHRYTRRSKKGTQTQIPFQLQI
jgi:hypothetical protein